MPDNSPHYSWQQLARDVLNIVQIVALAYVARLGNVNHAQVEQKTTEIVQKQDEAVATAHEVKTDLGKDAKRNARANEVKLYEAWKYLEGIAAESGLKKDIDRAADAKRVLDEFVSHKNGG